MAFKGKKIKCKSCGAKYYDLGIIDKPCPKCNINPIKISKNKFKKNIKKEESSEKLNIDFFYLDNDKNNQFITILNNTVKLNASLFWIKGWYAVKHNHNNIINVDDPNLVYINSSPINGLKTVLSNNKFPGIGQITITAIVEKNPNEIMNVLSKDKLEITKILNVTNTIATSLSDGWEENKNEFLSEIFFRELSFSTIQIKKIHEQLKTEILTILSQKPIKILGKIPRVTFEQIENIYRRLSKDFTDEDKSFAAIQHWLMTTEDRVGHTCAPKEKVIKEASNKANLDEKIVLRTLENEKTSFPESKRKNKILISTFNSHQRDQNIIKEIDRLIKSFVSTNKKSSFIKSELKMPKGVDLSDEQIQAINTSVNNPVSTITGGPGSGKSTMIVGLVKALELLDNKILLCAPTGRAATRLSDYSELKKHKPITIHMYLTLLNSQNQKKYDYIIVDESSMIDINLFLELLKSIPNDKGLVFIGDGDQLSPIGPGQPFKDIIEANTLPLTRLTGNYRQDKLSPIVGASRAIRQGKVPDKWNNDEFEFIECLIDQQSKIIIDLFFNNSKDKEKPQILSPQRKGEAGIININNIIQHITAGSKNPIYERKDDNVKFFQGDKIIQTSNNYELMVMNGDVGKILRKDGNEFVIFINDKEINYTQKDIYQIELAYAISIHKSQGSEYPYTIIPISSEHEYMLSRNLIYTGITRGKKKVILVGEYKAFEKGVNDYIKDFRYTNLISLITEKFISK